MIISIDVGDNWEIAELLTSVERLSQTLDSEESKLSGHDCILVLTLLTRVINSVPKEELTKLYLDDLIKQLSSLAEDLKELRGEK